MSDLVRLAAERPAEEVSRPAETDRAQPQASAAGWSAPPAAPTQGRTPTAAASRVAGWSGVLVRILVRVLVALGLALLAFVFLEAWLPGLVVETLGSWLFD